jgi:hypothetical protein
LITYTGKKRIGAVALNATTPVKIISDPSRGRRGYRLYNPDGTNRVLIIEVMRGQQAPVAADFAEVLDFNVNVDTTVESGASDDIDVYGLTSSGNISVAVSELFGPRSLS